MIPKMKYFIQCDEVRNDNGKLAAIGIFDSIYALIYPAQHKRFFIMMGFVGGQEKHHLQVNIASPNGDMLAEVKGEVVFSSSENVVNTVFAIDNMPLPVEGKYPVSIFLDGDFFSEQYFLVQSPNSGVKRTPEQIAELLKRDDILKTASVEMTCEKCRANYRFQQDLDPAASPKQGFMRLPPGEFFNCGSCGNKIDIAQLRRNLDNIVGIPQSWMQQSQGDSQRQASEPQQGPSQEPPNK